MIYDSNSMGWLIIFKITNIMLILALFSMHIIQLELIC